MKYLKVFSLIVFLFFISCNSKNDFISDVKPKQLISEDKFIKIFSDIILLESTVLLKSQNEMHIYNVMNASSLEVLKHYHISKKQYEITFDYYAQDKEKMTEIYTKILDDYSIKLSKVK